MGGGGGGGVTYTRLFLQSNVASHVCYLVLWRPSSETAVCPGGQFCAVDGEACLGYFSDEGVLKAAGTCVSGRCRCNVGDDEGWDPCSCLRKLSACTSIVCTHIQCWTGEGHILIIHGTGLYFIHIVQI